MHGASGRLVCCAAAAFISWSVAALATTIDPLLFEEMVLGSDFVGIVECQQAGGIVANYRVIESWKGPKPGSCISIRVAVNYWEPQFPIALCGERYFVTAYKEAPTTIMSTTLGGGVPLWWRKIPADYQLPLFQGRKLLAAGEEKSPDFDKTTRNPAKALLALAPTEHETVLLKAVLNSVIKADLSEEKRRGGDPDEARTEEIRQRIVKLPTADAVVAEILRLSNAEPEKWSRRAGFVLRKGGRATTLARLERTPADELPWKKSDLDYVFETIKRRCGSPPPQPAPSDLPPEEEKPPTEPELAKLRKTFAAGPGSEAFGRAFESLLRHDPGPVAEFAVNWKTPGKTWKDADSAYELGSYFAWRCGKERQKYLTILLQAKEPFVRVAGAVYLCFENADAGTAELKKLLALEGDPGVWAALTLARRGHKDAVPRALEVFRASGDQSESAGMAVVSHHNLQKRLLVLFSNAAREGNVPQPRLPRDETQQMKYIADWWTQYGDKLKLQDPWSAILEKQKVD